MGISLPLAITRLHYIRWAVRMGYIGIYKHEYTLKNMDDDMQWQAVYRTWSLAPILENIQTGDWVLVLASLASSEFESSGDDKPDVPVHVHVPYMYVPGPQSRSYRRHTW